MSRLPAWLGDLTPPLTLVELEAVIAQLTRFMRSVAAEAFACGTVTAAECSRWLGAAALRLGDLAPTPRPELLGNDLQLGQVPSCSLEEGLEQLAAVLEVLGSSPGWGDRNLAFLARSLAAELAWWRERLDL